MLVILCDVSSKENDTLPMLDSIFGFAYSELLDLMLNYSK